MQFFLAEDVIRLGSVESYSLRLISIFFEIKMRPQKTYLAN